MSNNTQSTFKEFETSVKWLFGIDSVKLEKSNLKINDESFDAFLKECRDTVKITSDGLFEEIKMRFLRFRLPEDLYDIELAFDLLKGLATKTVVDGNGSTPVQFFCKTGKPNTFLALFLILKIRIENQNKIIKLENEFFSRFSILVNEIKGNTVGLESKFDSESNEMSLILVFGKSHWAAIKEIINKYIQKQLLDDTDYNLLQNKYVWYRYKPSNQLSSFEDDPNGNMCFLTIDITLDNPPKIGNTMHIQDLIEKTKTQPSIITDMKLGNSFDLGSSGLNAKGFIKV